MMMIEDTKPWYARQLTADLAGYKPIPSWMRLILLTMLFVAFYCALYIHIPILLLILVVERRSAKFSSCIVAESGKLTLSVPMGSIWTPQINFSFSL